MGESDQNPGSAFVSEVDWKDSNGAVFLCCESDMDVAGAASSESGFTYNSEVWEENEVFHSILLLMGDTWKN